MKRSVLLLMLLFFVMTVFGCSSSNESKIIGKWVCKSSEDRIEISADHKCVIHSMGFQYPGKWTLTKSELKIDAGQVTLSGIIDANKFTAEDAIMHNKYIYEKLK